MYREEAMLSCDYGPIILGFGCFTVMFFGIWEAAWRWLSKLPVEKCWRSWQLTTHLKGNTDAVRTTLTKHTSPDTCIDRSIPQAALHANMCCSATHACLLPTHEADDVITCTKDAREGSTCRRACATLQHTKRLRGNKSNRRQHQRHLQNND